MNAITKVQTDERDLIDVLTNSLYPGAKPDSVRLVLSWCRATGRDPMKKPVHIVPMSVKKAGGGYEWRDVLMPGIGTYRTDAARTGEYVGKDEPEFGPDKTHSFDGITVTFPVWCKVTVHRYIHGQSRAFTAKEYWSENYATGKENKGVNAMWQKRPYGQLAKCAEAQAIRMAFPDETGNSNTAEEMEGKGEFAGTTIEARVEPETQSSRGSAQSAKQSTEEYLGDSIPEEPVQAKERKPTFWDHLANKLSVTLSRDDVAEIRNDEWVAKAFKTGKPEQASRINAMMEARMAELPNDADDAPEAEDVPPVEAEPEFGSNL